MVPVPDESVSGTMSLSPEVHVSAGIDISSGFVKVVVEVVVVGSGTSSGMSYAKGTGGRSGIPANDNFVRAAVTSVGSYS